MGQAHPLHDGGLKLITKYYMVFWTLPEIILDHGPWCRPSISIIKCGLCTLISKLAEDIKLDQLGKQIIYTAV